jgi:serine/threonine-protein kinase HipA
MIHLNVWLRPLNGPAVRIGEIVVSDPDTHHGGRMRGEFRYAPEYLENPKAFALDPLHLPLNPSPARTENPVTGLHGVFEDSLPDAWGQALLYRRHNVPRQQRRAAYLLDLLGVEAMGALAYTPKPVLRDEHQIAELPDLADLLSAAAQYEGEPDAPFDEMMPLFVAGSSPGGARPKVLVKDSDTFWLAKLPSIYDSFDIVRVEAATLATARDAGIEIPEFSVLNLGQRSALLVKRFDVTEQGGRNHVVSMKTLLAAENYYYLGYADMADIVRQVSDEPGNDLRNLFRQAVFNALIGNTDDHLKNFSMMRSERGWHLTPAYDLLPDVNNNREHVLHYGAVGTLPSMASFHWLGKAFGLSPKAIKRTIEQVVNGVSGFASQCEAYSVCSKDWKTLVKRTRLCTYQAGRISISDSE